MAEYYVFETEQDAVNCINYINNTDWFPLAGNVQGEPAPETHQKTVAWVLVPFEMLSGEWAVPRIPSTLLDAVNVPQADRDAFLTAFGQDIRELDGGAFPEPEIT